MLFNFYIISKINYFSLPYISHILNLYACQGGSVRVIIGHYVCYKSAACNYSQNTSLTNS